MSKHAIPGFPKGLFVAQPFIWMFFWQGMPGLCGCSRPCPVRVLVLQLWVPVHVQHTSPKSSDFSGIFLYNKNANAFAGWAQSSQFSSNKEKNKKCGKTWTLVAVLTAKVFPGSLSNFSSLFPRTAASNLNCKWRAGDCCAALPELMLCFHVFSFINSGSAPLC